MAAIKKRRQRLNLAIPTELLEWAKVFADKKNRTVTSFVVEYFTELKEKNHG